MPVYIPTMGRHDNLRKIIPRWIALGIPVVLVVEKREYRSHVQLRDEEGWTGRVRIASTMRPNPSGVGYARRACVVDAERHGYESIIMSDDDMRPHSGSDMRALLRESACPGVLGVGAVRSIHDRFTGGAVSANSGVILCPGGWGFQMFGLNIRTAIAVGNFDASLHSYGEDGELARQGISRGIPWLAHCDVYCDPIGKRYAPGGINSRFLLPEYRTAAERQCLDIIHRRWPRYTNSPDKPLRVSWQKMLDDFIPDWRKLSAIHGGVWDPSVLPGAR